MPGFSFRYLTDRKVTDSMKVFAALGVFFCHCFPQVNFFGWLFVSVFFFASGVGYARKKTVNLADLLPLYGVWVAYIALYSLVNCDLRLFLPHCWYLVIYGLEVLLVRFLRKWEGVFLVNCIVAYAMVLTGEFTFPWYASFMAFPFGMYLVQGCKDWSFKILFLITLLIPLWLLSYLSVIILGTICTRINLQALAPYTKHFYFVHYLFCCLFGMNAWGRSMSLTDCTPLQLLLALSCSCLFSYLVTTIIQQKKGTC